MNCTISQLALAWLFNRNPKMIAICGCDTLAYLAENLGALEIRLSEERIDRIGKMFASGNVSGDRYGAALISMLDR
jgi:aryl-alcohol dehydrogenase-like predicted oxidoreductase